MAVKRASIQSTRLAIRSIQDGVVSLPDSEYRAILEVSGTARPFEDEARLAVILAGFGVFLNGLSYPLQILVRASPVDLSRYLAALEERGRTDMDGQLADLAHDHATFIQKVARQRTLLERRFYVVVPAENAARVSWISRLRRRQVGDDEPRREAARRQLTFRCEDVSRQLARCGLAARRLGDLELAQLYLACWSPERARAQRFRQQLDDYTTLAVRGATSVRAME